MSKPETKLRCFEAWPVAVVGGCALLLGFAVTHHPKLMNNPVTAINNITVIRELEGRSEAWRYEFKDESGSYFYQDICKDYLKPEFDAGLRIKRLIYMDLEDLGQDCWSLDPDKGGGYYKQRDANGKPVYAEAK